MKFLLLATVLSTGIVLTTANGASDVVYVGHDKVMTALNKAARW